MLYRRQQDKNLGTRAFANSLIVLAVFVFLPAMPLHVLIGLGMNGIKAIFLVVIILTVCFLLSNKIINPFRTNLVIPILLVYNIAFAFLLSQMTSQLLSGIALLLMVVLSKPAANIAFTKRSINMLFYLSVIILIGAWVGFYYTLYVSIVPTLSTTNPNGMMNSLYLTTFSNSDRWWGFIRPAGIFDEAGALSFFTILVVCLIELYNVGRIKSIILLGLGLITFSLTHLLCVIVYVIVMFRNRKVFVFLFFSILVGFAYNYIPEDNILDRVLFNRLQVTGEGRLMGDNRSNQVDEFFSLIDSDISIYGERGMIKRSGGRLSAAVDQSSNPFMIWFNYGFLIWLPYAILLIVLFSNYFHSDRSVQITSIMMTILLLQRPYIYSMYWGFAIWFVISAMFIKKTTKHCTALLGV